MVSQNKGRAVKFCPRACIHNRNLIPFYWIKI